MAKQSNLAIVEGLLFISGDEGITLTDLVKLPALCGRSVRAAEPLKAKVRTR